MAKRESDAAQPLETVQEQRKHLQAILEKLPNMMFGTHDANHELSLSVRPLRVTKLESDGTMWFMVGLDSGTVAQVRKRNHVIVTSQDSSRWVALSGRCEVVTDRAKIKELFTKMHEVWFPDGAEDPNICLLHFQPQHAEYWDNTGVIGVKLLFESVKALLTGTTPDPIKGVHGDLHPRTV